MTKMSRILVNLLRKSTQYNLQGEEGGEIKKRQRNRKGEK